MLALIYLPKKQVQYMPYHDNMIYHFMLLYLNFTEKKNQLVFVIFNLIIPKQQNHIYIL